MTWTISFAVDQGKVDPATLKVVGDPPDGPISVNGHQSGTSRSLNVQAAGSSAYASTSLPAADTPPKE